MYKLDFDYFQCNDKSSNRFRMLEAVYQASCKKQLMAKHAREDGLFGSNAADRRFCLTGVLGIGIFSIDAIDSL